MVELGLARELIIIKISYFYIEVEVVPALRRNISKYYLNFLK